MTGVDVTNDLSQAKIYLSVFGDEEAKKDSLKGLEKANGFLRTELGKRIRLRHTPELIFKIDESIAYGSRIEKLLGDISDDAEK
ncbi:Ribosome-binding factor A [compost metagenome]